MSFLGSSSDFTTKWYALSNYEEERFDMMQMRREKREKNLQIAEVEVASAHFDPTFTLGGGEDFHSSTRTFDLRNRDLDFHLIKRIK